MITIVIIVLGVLIGILGKVYFKKYSEKGSIYLLLIILLILGLFILGCVIRYHIINSSAKDIDEVWYSFLGDYLGGSTALIGVVITIIATRQDTKKQLDEQRKNDAMSVNTT